MTSVATPWEMAFVPFPKICSDASKLSGETNRCLQKMRFDAYEKVHGSCFCVACDEHDRVRFGKRTGFLEPDEWFFNYQVIAEGLVRKARALRAEAGADRIIIYGELCGGWYPSNPRMWKGARAAGRINARGYCPLPLDERAVQECVYYSHAIRFIAFGVMCCETAASMPRWTPLGKVRSMCKKVGMFTLEPLNRKGPLTLSKGMQHPHEFESRVATELFGHAPLPDGTNQAEGLVLVPDDAWIMHTGGDPARYVMFKHKHKEFSEVSGEFEGASAEMQLAARVNPNRLSAVLSKIGRADSQKQVVEAYVEDVWEDFGHDTYVPDRVKVEAATYALVEAAVAERFLFE